MSDLTNIQLDPPANWQDFESLCQALWKRLWGDPDTQRNGRSGQPQAGIDVCGLPKGESKYAGIQCKGRDGRYGKEITEAELLEEVEKAKSFKPPLGRFILATTANTDVKIQELARNLTLDHRSHGLFDVSVMSWPEIQTRLAEHPEVAGIYYPHQADLGRKALSAVIEDRLSSRKHAEQVLSQLSAMHQDVRSLAVGHGKEDVDREVGAQLDQSRQLLQDQKPDIALQLLESLRQRVWSTASANNRFRMLTNIGSAKLDLGKETEAAEDLLDAYACDSSTEKAHANRVLALLLKNELDAAASASEEAIHLFPKSPIVWAKRINVMAARAEEFDPETLLPADLPANEELFHVVGVALGRSEKLANAETWLRRALVLKQDSAQIQIALGGCLAEQVSRRGKLHPGSQLTDVERGQLDEAVGLLSNALGRLDQLGSARWQAAIAQCAANLSSVLIVLSEPTKALEVIDTGLRHSSSDTNLLVQKTRLLLSVDRGSEAFEVFAKLPSDKAKAHSLLYAEYLKRAGNLEGALSFLEDLIGASPDKEEGQVGKCAFIEACMSQGKSYEERKSRALRVLALGTPDYRSELLFAEEAKANNDSEEATKALARARRSVEQDNSARAWTSLGDTLFWMEETDEALDIYRRYCSPLNDGQSLRNFVKALISADRRRELTDLFQKIPESITAKSFYQLMLGEMAYQAGDFRTALPHFERRLALSPNDYRSRSRWAEIQLAVGNKASVEEFIDNQKQKEAELGSEEAVEVARICRAIGQPLEALRMIYGARRRYPASETVNMAFVSCILGDRDLGIPTDPRLAIGNDTAFAIEHGHKQSIFLIENRNAADLRSQEIRPDHPLAVRAMNLRAGDPVVVSESPFSRDNGTVIWVKHKYLHAFHETLETFEARFPHQKGLYSVPIQKKGDEMDMTPLLKAVDEQAARSEALTALYTERHAPLCVVAKARGLNVLDLWRGFINDTTFDIAVCIGTQDERNAALEVIQKNDKGFVLEPVSLYLLHALLVLPAIEKIFGKIAVTKAALDVYRDVIAERNFSRDGYMSVGKVKGQYIRQEISAADIAENVKQLQGILDWAEANCEILTALPRQDLTEMDPRAAREVMGDAFFDTLLASNGSGRVLISDDLQLRNLARQSFAVEAVWTQVVLMALRAKGELSAEQYADALATLVQSKYRHTTITAYDLFIAGKMDDWTNGTKFGLLAATLSSRSLQFTSLVSVVGEFLTRIWRINPLEISLARRVTFALLEKVAIDRWEHFTAFYSATVLRIPAAAAGAVREWYEGHLLLVPGGERV